MSQVEGGVPVFPLLMYGSQPFRIDSVTSQQPCVRICENFFPKVSAYGGSPRNAKPRNPEAVGKESRLADPVCRTRS